jgi:hypothetical protein
MLERNRMAASKAEVITTATVESFDDVENVRSSYCHDGTCRHRSKVKVTGEILFTEFDILVPLAEM